MADRAPPPNLRPGNRTTRATANIAGVRRNLFQSHLTRRPTSTESTRPGASTASTTGTAQSSSSVETLGIDIEVLSDSSEIVIRDQNGEFEVGNPPTPPLDDLDDEVVLDGAQENERERHKLAEAVRHHQINRTCMPAQPEEVLEALKASLRAKVAALADDNWMYETEEVLRS
ncbi:hypothetical protein GGR50DRAFT_299028 [Xylaria sp. CBS 124048]|nr:hypothetical protein GGR50DRAFT_299028 [Xylaria sp. CBS 124048]